MNWMARFYQCFLVGFILVSCHTTKNTTNSSEGKTKSKTKTETGKSTSSSKMKNVANILGVNESDIKNEKLYQFISAWYGTPYKYGGCDIKGTDCSCLTINLYKEVYKKNLPRTADEIFKSCDKLSSSKVEKGDMVFFKIESKQITHVGVYLKNNKFIHASTKKGVMISDLNEPYFKKYFYTFGRLK